MTTHSSIPGTGRIVKIAIATIILLALILAPAFSEVRSVRARVIQKPNAPTTVRKANFQAGDILATPLVSITVVNDSTPAFLKLGLELEFGGSWTGDYLKGSVIKRLGANESITFDNTKLLDNLDSVRWADVSNSPTLTEHTGVTGVSTIGNLTNLPEGTYTLYLTVSEVTLSDPNDIQSTITSETELIKKTDSNAKVEFKVVTIGGIGSISLPTVTGKSLTFQVPEIPIYSDSRSSTRITINGPGITNYTATKSHAKSEGVGGLKGYPSDLTNGYVTYDLTALNFRAGQTYTIDIEFIDWNNLPITSKTTSVTFPAVRMSGTTDLADPYLPVFSWAFSGTDYSEWVKEYRIYVNGAYKGYTADTSYQLRESDRLTPGTVYSWYAMPINKDGSNLLDSAASITRSFTTAAHTRLDVTITQPSNGAVLFKDESYSFSGAATCYDGAVEKPGGAVWSFGNESRTGLEVQYTPRTRATSGSPLQASLTVTDSFNLAKSSPTISMTVLAPDLAMQGDATRQVDKGQSVSFAATATDLAKVEWFIDDTSIGTGATRAYAFTEVGTHRVHAVGTSAEDVQGATKTVRSASVTVNVVGMAPVVTITQPGPAVAATATMRQGSILRIIAGIANENTLTQTTWTVAGPDTSQNGATGASLSFRPQEAGYYYLTVTAVDSAQKQGQATLRINVVNPVITVYSPTDNQVYSTMENIRFNFSAPGSAYYFWYSNGIPIYSAGPVRYSTPGNNQVAIAAVYWLLNQNGVPTETTIVATPVNVVVKDAPPLPAIITAPAADSVLLAGTTYTFMARVQAEDSLIADQWWDVDGTRLSGNTYTPSASMRRQVMATFHVRSIVNVETRVSVPLRIINPSARLVWTGPLNYQIEAGQPVPVVAMLQDVESMRWQLDLAQTREADWDRILTEPGLHSLAMQWSTRASNPSTWSTEEFRGLSFNIPFTVYSNEPPVISVGVPANNVLRYATGDMVNFSVTVTGATAMSEIKWQVSRDGSEVRNATGARLSHMFADPGSYTVRATAMNSRGRTADREWLVKVIAPSIAIQSPLTGSNYAQSSMLPPALQTRDIDAYTLILDGTAVPAGFIWSRLPLGSHTLGAEGSYATSGTDTPRKVAANPQTFSISNRLPPSFTVEGVRDGDRLIAGRQYTFTTTSSGGETFTWIRSGSSATFNGPSYSFTPAATDREITFTVRGLRNGIIVDKTFIVTVIDPYVNIILPKQAWFPADLPIPLQAERRAIDRMEWSVNGQAFRNSAVTLPAGQHSLAAKGFAAGVRLPSGNYGDWEYTGTGRSSASLRVANAPRITRLTLSSTMIQSDGSVTATAAVEGDTTLVESITFFLDGTRISSGTATSRSFDSVATGTHTVRAVLAVSGGTDSAADSVFTVFAPMQIAITRPANGAVFTPDESVEAAMEVRSGQASSLEWYLDGSLLPDSNTNIHNFGRLVSGTHRIELRAANPAGATASASVSVTVPSDLALGLAAPTTDTEIIIGNSITCLAQVNKVAGSELNITNAAQYISWYVDGRDSGTKGLSYLFTGNAEGEKTIQARYSNEGLIRASPERKIKVRDIAAPAILLPMNGMAIRYAVGSPVVLKATGEPGSIFTWSIDGNTIATGSETSFIPAGLTGQKQIKLVTNAYGRSLERIVTVTLTPNNAPVLALSAAALQFAGQNLSFNAYAADPDEQEQSLPVSMTFDGLPLASGTARVLTDADIGTHSLAATATDAMGASASMQVEVKVESDRVNVDILSPVPGQPYLRQSGGSVPVDAISLLAAVSSPGSSIVPLGTLTWTVHYLDNPSTAPVIQTGLQTRFQPAAMGELLITARYVSSMDTQEAGKELGVTSVRIRVEERGSAMTIVWPHGRVVGAGARLAPAVSWTQNVPQSQIRWTLDGIEVPDIGALVAPNRSGEHVLVASHTVNGSTSRAEVTFEVNQRPRLRITGPAAGTMIPYGDSIALTAVAEDDQPAGVIRWDAISTRQNGTGGEGSIFFIRESMPGQWRVSARVTDPYGLVAEATTEFSVYDPMTGVLPVVNGGLPGYHISLGNIPLAANVQFSGGIAPQATWTMSQGEITVRKTGVEVLFTHDELADFADGPATITMTLADAGIADEAVRPVVRRDFTIELTRSAVIERILPAQDFAAYVGEAVPLELAVTGFFRPRYTVQIDGQPVTLPWTVTDDGARYTSQLPPIQFAREGVYQISVTMTEGLITRTISFDLTVYQRRTGIFVDNPPTLVDLEQPPAPVVRVTRSGLERVNEYRWTNDLSPRVQGLGETMRLNASMLSPGIRTVTVQAFNNGQPGSSASFTLKVLGSMQLEIPPSGESWTLRKGLDFTISARARDRDGTELPGSAIRWSSHIAGPLGSGERLPATALQNLAAGEHVITVSAIGATGSTISAIRTLRIIATPATGDGGSGGGGSGGEGGGGRGGGAFDEGRLVDGPSGGQGILGNNSLLRRFKLRP